MSISGSTHPLGSLSTFPPEIRRMIYREVFSSGSISILQTSQSTNADARDAFSASGVFHLNINPRNHWWPRLRSCLLEGGNTNARNVSMRVNPRGLAYLSIENRTLASAIDLLGSQDLLRDCRIFVECPGSFNLLDAMHKLNRQDPFDLHNFAAFETVEVIFESVVGSMYYDGIRSHSLSESLRREGRFCNDIMSRVGSRL